jgi:glycosyltransferase involved in cell wall biosynthesis
MPPLKLEMPYLLVLNIPVYAWDGGFFTDQLWAHDLRRHLDHIADLTLLCPVRHEPPPDGMVRLDLANGFRGLRIEGVRPADSLLQALWRLPADFSAVYRAAKRCRIVHASAIGWPIPLGYYAFIAATLLPRFFIDVMESSPWRLVPGARSSPARRLRAILMETAARWIAHRSQLSLFTSEAYRRSMVPDGQAEAHVFKAVWVTRDQIIDRAALAARLEARRGGRLVAGFAARLLPEKGVLVLLDALQKIAPDVQLTLRAFGAGELENEMRRFAASPGGRVNLEFLGLIEYGTAFFDEIDRWDVLVVPSLSVEQPRIVYDAFARGVPVIASDTSALAECVSDGVDGYLFATGDAAALAQSLSIAARDRAALEQCAFRALETAAAHSHERMHEQRAVLIDAAWRQWSANSSRRSQAVF